MVCVGGTRTLENERRQRMCGDLEDDTRLDDELFARLVALAGRYGVAPPERRPPPADLAGEDARHAYMSRLFSEVLTRSVSDAAAYPEGRRADAIADQAIVLARLAGFLAAQLPPGTDLFLAIVEAMIDGYGEPGRRRAEARDHHHHHHHHEH